MIKHKLNWKPDVPDQRDFLFRDHFKVSKTLPKSKSLKAKMSPVEDQGELGSCTANAFAGNLEYLYLLKKDKFQASRLFIYYNERVVIGEVHDDSGANLRDGIKTLAKYGVCSEMIVPYVIADFTDKPSKAAYAAALARKIYKYVRITDLQSMKQCLADGFPFVLGIPVYESFESDAVARTGVVPMPKKSEQMLGGHAVCCVGYDDASKRFLVRNSWGAGWGQKGYFTIPYDYVTKMGDDMWTIRA